MNIQKRDVAISIVLSIVTCGIYSIYWLIKLTDETNQLSGDSNATSGGMVFLLTLVTCGIYGIYWAYKQGERLDNIKVSRGEAASNQAVIYLVLSIFGFGIIAYALMQSEINKIVTAQ